MKIFVSATRFFLLRKIVCGAVCVGIRTGACERVGVIVIAKMRGFNSRKPVIEVFFGGVPGFCSAARSRRAVSACVAVVFPVAGE